mmetsp:Transcript_20149/g.24429  ORF Transcript_20149/g.24429 Transcript_20149/m.24429 type:complete len:112 (+) Transcript_20149:655-990(+)
MFMWVQMILHELLLYFLLKTEKKALQLHTCYNIFLFLKNHTPTVAYPHYLPFLYFISSSEKCDLRYSALSSIYNIHFILALAHFFLFFFYTVVIKNSTVLFFSYILFFIYT